MDGEDSKLPARMSRKRSLRRNSGASDSHDEDEHTRCSSEGSIGSAVGETTASKEKQGRSGRPAVRKCDSSMPMPLGRCQESINSLELQELRARGRMHVSEVSPTTTQTKSPTIDRPDCYHSNR